MATRILTQNALISSATAFATATTAPGLHATTNTTITTNGVFSAVFTAPALSAACLGGIIYQVAKPGTSNDLTLTLQEYTGSTWVDKTSATIAYANTDAAQFLRFEFSAPYTFATLTAGYYRFKVQTSALSPTAAANSAGTAISVQGIDSRSGALGATDDLILLAPNGTGTGTLTIAGTCGFGSQTLLPTTTARNIGWAAIVGSGCTIYADRIASSTLTILGSIALYGGKLDYGTANNPIPAGVIASRIWNQNGAGGRSALCVHKANSQIFDCGTLPASGYTRTTYVSGAGTTASPLTLSDAVDWTVNDEIVLAPTGGANQTEWKFILTKISANSYTLADSKGGAESGLSYTRVAGAHVALLERNVVTTTNSASQYFTWFRNVNISSGNIALIAARYERTGGPGNNNDYGIYLRRLTTDGVAVCNDVVIYAPLSTFALRLFGRFPQTQSINRLTYTRASVSSTIQLAGTKNVVLDDLWLIGVENVLAGLALNTSTNFTSINRAIVAGIGSTGSSGISFNGAQALNRWTDGYSYSNVIGISWGAAINNVVNNVLFGLCAPGISAPNTTADLLVVAESYCIGQFTDCSFGSPNLWTGLASGVDGSEYVFERPNGTGQRWYYVPLGFANSNVELTRTLLGPNQTDVPMELTWNALTDDIAGYSVWCGIKVQIRNAAYYAGSHVMPTLILTADLGMNQQTYAGSATTDVQIVSGTITPASNRNLFNLRLEIKSDAITPNNEVEVLSVRANIRAIGRRFVDVNYDPAWRYSLYPVFSLITPLDDLFWIERNPVTLATLSNKFSVDHVNKTVTVLADATINEMYCYEKYDLTLTANRDDTDWFTTIDGNNYESQYDVIISTGVTLTGNLLSFTTKTLILNGTGWFTGDISYPSSKITHIRITGIVPGSTLQLLNSSDNQQIMKAVITGSSLDLLFTYTGSAKNLRVRIRKAGYHPFEYNGTAYDFDFNLPVVQVDDSIYSANNIDGSAVTEFSLVEGVIKVYVDDPDNVTTAQRLYNRYMYLISSLDYIDDQTDEIAAQTPYSYVFSDSLKIKSMKSDVLFLTGANINNVSNNGQVIDTSGGPINISGYFPFASLQDVGAAVWADTDSYMSGSKGADVEAIRDKTNGVLGMTTDEHNALMLLQDIEAGDWELDPVNNQMVIKKKDHSSVILKFDLKDRLGHPTTEGVYSRRSNP